MNKRLIAAAAIAVLFLNGAVAAGVKAHGEKAKRTEAERLVSLLPASDVIAILDSRLLIDETLPKLLAGYGPMLVGVLEKLRETQDNTGLDFAKFDQIAFGVSSKRISPTETDFVPVAIANGSTKTVMAAISKLAADGIYGEEKSGGTTVYVSSIKAFSKKKADSKLVGFVDRSLGSITKDLAVAALDGNTIVFGSHSRVLETLESRSRPHADLTSLLSYDKRAILSFSARTSPTMLKLLPLSNNDFGETLDSIQILAGSFEVEPAGIGVQLMAKIETPERARTLQNTISALRVLARSVYGSSKRVDQQIYGRMINGAKVGAKGTDLTVRMFVPRDDLDTLIHRIK